MATYYKIKLCPKWNKNPDYDKCLYGENCKFAHGHNELRCKFYQEGNCKYGEDCYLVHDTIQIVDKISKKVEQIDEDNELKQNILFDLKNNEFIKDIKQNNCSIQFTIDVDNIKKQNTLDWVSDTDEIKSEEYKTDPFSKNEDTNFEIVVNDDKSILDSYILDLKKYIEKIENNKNKLLFVDDILWKKLKYDLRNNEDILKI